MIQPSAAAPDLARTLAFIAADLDERGYPYAGAVRHAARELVTLRRLAADRTVNDTGCSWCGSPLAQKARGRPRRFCSRRCRSAAGRKAPNAIV